MAEAQQKYFLALLKRSISDNNLKNCEIYLNGSSTAHGGYTGEIITVNIIGKDEKNYNLLVKKAVPDKNIRNKVPIRQSYVTEIFVYTVVFEVFEQFQKLVAADTLYPSVPRCLGSNLDNAEELLILENLDPKGYQIHDTSKPMNLQHLHLVLGEYARLHALSFALKYQRPDAFVKLSKDKFRAVTEALTSKPVVAKLEQSFRSVSEVLRLTNRLDLLDKFEALCENLDTKFYDTFNADEPQSVFVHGDCWNNNFLFKYEVNDTDNPVAVCLIDFQLSNILSPTFDLSFFLFTTCSKNEYQHFDSLLRFYYSNFATFLAQLGSNPDELFSFDDLLIHWRKYSILGFVIAPLSLKFVFNENENLRLEKLTSDKHGFLIKTNLNEYNQRLVDITDQYFKSLGI